MGDRLLVDISNSFAKLALASADGIEDRRQIETDQLSQETLSAELKGWDFARAIVCSVVPEKRETLAAALDVPILETTHEIDLGIGIDYPQPETIGQDRLANAAALAALYGAPGIVVDFGTAVTFDIVTKDRDYAGGIIAPGLSVMTDYMFQRTALLPKIDLVEPVEVVGKSTESAMRTGAVVGYRGLVKEILKEVRHQIAPGRWRPRLKVVATGGYSELIAAKVPEIKEVDPNLTLEGLRIIGNLNP